MITVHASYTTVLMKVNGVRLLAYGYNTLVLLMLTGYVLLPLQGFNAFLCVFVSAAAPPGTWRESGLGWFFQVGDWIS